MRRSLVWLVTFALVSSATTSAHAFTTRVHIALSNEVRQALIESADGRTIQLRWSTYAVQIPQEDADAIINQPLAFRAGSIGPDNVVFPAMTDGTHGMTQDPYRQCEILHQQALTEAERAYALGCLLHGSTDAIAHHFVNHFTGETFTLNPISASRASDYDNVIGHIVTESVIQSAYHAGNPTALSGIALEHDIPQDFVLRMYFDVESPVWQRMAEEPMVKWDAARAADPGGTVLGWAQSAGFGPWEQIAMAPVYIAELQTLREGVRTTMTDRIATLAADAELGVTAGPDGMIGTPDDATACSSGCPTKFGEYYVLVRMLAPRMDAAGNPLPSAFDKISDSLGDDLYGFLPAFVQVIANLSRELNTPIPAGDTEDHGLDITPATIATVFGPIDDWSDRTFAIDYETLGRAVSPTWYTDLSDFLSRFGVSVSIPNIMRALLGPIVDQIRDALINEVRDRARTFIDELSSEYRARFGGWRTDVEGALVASEPSDLGGHALEHAADSGLFAYAFNITAATLANHEVMLVGGDPIPDGPTSFDASYTMSWTQLGLCDYLRGAVFPAGTDVRALLSVRQGDTMFPALLEQDAPVECHDGALDVFGTASVATCEHTDLERLLTARRGSLTRAYPPGFASGMPACRDLIVPGLPEPPERPDAGMSGLDGGVAGGDGGAPPMTMTTGGCCSVA
ncbi:MAG: hypothetical protein M3Y87_15970, partial [Myxococcota bacterium]|nr:hypothetical protein [Myxococcota bacterium]